MHTVDARCGKWIVNGSLRKDSIDFGVHLNFPPAPPYVLTTTWNIVKYSNYYFYYYNYQMFKVPREHLDLGDLLTLAPPGQSYQLYYDISHLLDGLA